MAFGPFLAPLHGSLLAFARILANTPVAARSARGNGNAFVLHRR
jgi:hypothetical protein